MTICVNMCIVAESYVHASFVESDIHIHIDDEKYFVFNY